MRILRENGFNVDLVTDPVCTPSMVLQLSNVHSRGPNENILEGDEIFRREGHVWCIVETQPLVPGAAPQALDDFERGKATARVWVANADCALYASDEDKDAQLARFQNVIDALDREARSQAGA
jgi:hypothetical protein